MWLLAHSGGVQYRDLFDDLEIKAFQRGDMGGSVGEQANLADIEIGKNLAADAHLTQHALMPVFLRRAGTHLARAGLVVQQDSGGGVTPINLKSRTVVMQVDERTTPGLGDALERALE